MTPNLKILLVRVMPVLLVLSGAFTCVFTTCTHALDIPCPTQTSSACFRDWISVRQDIAGDEIEVETIGEDVAGVVSLKPLRESLSSRMPAELALRDGRHDVRWFRVRVFREVPVWSRDSEAGVLAGSAQPVLRRTNIAVIGDVTNIATIDNLADSTLRHAVHAGNVVLNDDLAQPGDIIAGDAVHFSLASGRVRISGTGRALENGSVGRQLKILPMHGTQPIEALAAGKP